MNSIINKIPAGKNRFLTLTLKQNIFILFEQPGSNLWSFDLEGRPVGMFVEGKNYRRTLSNRLFYKSRSIGKNITRNVEAVPESQFRKLYDRSLNILKELNNYPAEYNFIINKILKVGFDGLEISGNSFRSLYLPISILPPDQYMALVVQLTEGCNFNQCLFCNFYKDRSFHIKSQAQIKKHLEALKCFFGEGLNLRKSIFLADANAMVTPTVSLVPILKNIKTMFPAQAEFYSFIDIFTGLNKSSEDFKLLKSLGLKRVYLGIESGHGPLLDFLQKPRRAQDIIFLAGMLKAAKINLGAIFLAGAGGIEYHEQHMLDSARLVKNLNLGKGDFVYISEYGNNSRDYIRKMEKFNLQLPTDLEILNSAKELKAVFSAAAPQEVKVSTYAINQFLY